MSVEYDHEPVGKGKDPSTRSKERKGLKTYLSGLRSKVRASVV